jgi:hypothetical protein
LVASGIAAKAACEVELRDALAREESEARAAAAAEARAFADAIEPMGAKLDRLLSEFKSTLLKMKSDLASGNLRGHAPSASQVEASCQQVFRVMFWGTHEFGSRRQARDRAGISPI